MKNKIISYLKNNDIDSDGMIEELEAVFNSKNKIVLDELEVLFKEIEKKDKTKYDIIRFNYYLGKILGIIFILEEYNISDIDIHKLMERLYLEN